MSYRLAKEVEERSGQSVAPMKLVHRALGARAREYHREDVYALAKQIGAVRIIWGFAEYRRGPQNRLYFCITDETNVGGSSDFNSRKWDNLSIKEHIAPYQVFSEQIPSIRSFLNLKETISPTRGQITEKSKIPLPDPLSELLTRETRDPLLTAYYLQLMGILAPEKPEYFRNQLFIQSLVAISNLNEGNREYRLLAARAYHYLYRRPTAVHLLEGAHTPAEKALLAVVNGNLYDIQQLVNEIQSPLKKLMANIELVDIKNAYGVHINPDDLIDIINQHEGYEYFLARRLFEDDPWRLFSNAPLKQILDLTHPIKGFDLKSLANALATSGKLEKNTIQFELYATEHIRKWLQAGGKNLNSVNNQPKVDDVCFLQWIEGMLEANLYKIITFQLNIQGRPEAALAIYDEISSIYHEHPFFTALLAMVLHDRLEDLGGLEYKTARAQLDKAAQNAIFWSGGQNWISSTGKKYAIKHIPRYSPDELIAENWALTTILFDYPRRFSFLALPKNGAGRNIRSLKHRLDWEWNGMEALWALHDEVLDSSGVKEAGKILDLYRNRFRGHPKWPTLRSVHALKAEGIDAYKQILQKEIDAGAPVWDYYDRLAQHYLYHRDFDRVKEIYLKYPGFHEIEGRNKVGLSNLAAQAGEALYRRGALEQSKPLYRISAEMDTGSAWCLKSKETLALLDGDFHQAADIALRQYRRYNMIEPYTRFIQLLHLFGESEKAWMLFDQVMEKYESKSIWQSALTGFQVNEWSGDKIIQWFKDRSDLYPYSQKENFPPRLGIHCMLDRKPNDDLISLIKELDQYKVSMNKNNRRSDDFSRKKRKTVYYLIDESEVDEIKKRNGDYLPYYGSFAEAYGDILKGDYRSAYDVFKLRNAYYGVRNYFTRPVLPYIIWAAVNSGNGVTVKNLVNQILGGKTNKLGFDMSLVCAAIAEDEGDIDKSISYLEAAYTFIYISTEKRPIPPNYALLEFCEWFYLKTADERYREKLVDWANTLRIQIPLDSFFHAFVAKYAVDREKKKEALAYALYMDPQSLRISDLDPSLKVEAQEWLKVHHPFGTQPQPSNGI